MNEIAQQRIKENKTSKNPHLDLSKLNLARIPNEIENFIWLEKLDLSQNKLTEIERLEKLRRLQELSLDQNQLTKIEGLESLENLQILHFSHNQLTKIEGLETLKNLQVLSLYQNQLRKMEGLEKLKNLEILYLYQNRFTKIEGLERLNKLELLSLDQNGFTKIEGLEPLVQLRGLDLSKNQFTKIEGLEKLKELQVLYFYQNQFTRIEGLEKLLQLQVLDLSKNQFTKIEGLETLTQLQVLDLSQNPIKNLTPLYDWLQKCKGNIYWESSQIEWESSPRSDSTYVSLKYDYRYVGTFFLTAKKGLYLKDCHSLKMPSAEWVQQGKNIVLDYLAAAKEQGTVEMNEAKLMIVGRPHAGKTSASIKLRDVDGVLPDSTETTRGVEVEDWAFQYNEIDYTAHLWDFGGQDVQYAIHQFFMTQRAVYLLVDCTRDPEKASHLMGETKSEIISNYWLQTIKNLAKSSPTFYLYNLFEPYSKNLSVFNNLERQYGDFLHKYPFEVNLHQLNKENEINILPVREKLQETIAALPNVGIVLPTQWATIKQLLAEAAEKNSYLTLDQFFELCEKNGVQDEQSALLISRYFHEIGSIIHYSEDSTSPLYKLVILRRKWATEATYQVILDTQIEKNSGKFTKEDLQRIWSKADYKNMTAELLELLQKFEICYQLPNANPVTYLIPQCLPDQYPDDIDAHLGNSLSIRYNYEFLPYGVINRLTVRLHENILDNKVWKQGMILENKKGRAIVEEVKNINKGFIRITVSGNQADRWYLQQKIMEQIGDLNQIFNLEKSTAIQVPCTCENCKKSEEPHLHNYKTLLEMLGEKIEEDRCGKKPFKQVKILDLIDHAFFTRPKEVEQSMKSKFDLRGAKIDKLVMGDNHEKQQTINAEDAATIQVADTVKDSVVSASMTNPAQKTNIWEYFKVRKLAGWFIGAVCAGILAYNIDLLRPWSGLIFIALIGWGAYTSLTSDGKYFRYAKWVLLIGLGAAGVLNGLPVIAGSFMGQIAHENSFIQFIGQYKMDEQPLITIIILVLTFGLASFLIYKDSSKE